MSSNGDRSARYVMPGDSPTDADLRPDIELTRVELGQTVSDLAAKADVKARASDAANRAAEPVRANPGTTAAVLAAVLVAVLVLRRLFKR